MATVPQQAVARNRRVLADVGNLINGQPALANHQKQVLVPVKNCRKAIPQVAARSRGVLADVGNHINGCRAPEIVRSHWLLHLTGMEKQLS